MASSVETHRFSICPPRLAGFVPVSRRESLAQSSLGFGTLALARKPSLAEIQWSAEHWDKQVELYRASNLTPDQAAHKALVNLCHTLLNTSEFLYVE